MSRARLAAVLLFGAIGTQGAAVSGADGPPAVSTRGRLLSASPYAVGAHARWKDAPGPHSKPQTVAPETPDAFVDKDFNACRKVPAGKRLVKLTLKPDTSVDELVVWISSITCRQFVWSDAITAGSKTVTIVAPLPMTPKQAFGVLERARLDRAHRRAVRRVLADHRDPQGQVDPDSALRFRRSAPLRLMGVGAGPAAVTSRVWVVPCDCVPRGHHGFPALSTDETTEVGRGTFHMRRRTRAPPRRTTADPSPAVDRTVPRQPRRHSAANGAVEMMLAVADGHDADSQEGERRQQYYISHGSESRHPHDTHNHAVIASIKGPKPQVSMMAASPYCDVSPGIPLRTRQSVAVRSLRTSGRAIRADAPLL